MKAIIVHKIDKNKVYLSMKVYKGDTTYYTHNLGWYPYNRNGVFSKETQAIYESDLKMLQEECDKYNLSIAWAKQMEKEIEMGSTVAETADGTLGEMIRILCCIWDRGEELRIWNNKRYGIETKGIVNKAYEHR